jgi:hypothetical protein
MKSGNEFNGRLYRRLKRRSGRWKRKRLKRGNKRKLKGWH